MNQSALQESFVAGEIRSEGVYGENYGEVWKGYFVPSVSGDYKFRGLADDAFAVYFSTGVYGSTVSFENTTPIAFSNSVQANSIYANYYYNDYPTHESDYITL